MANISNPSVEKKFFGIGQGAFFISLITTIFCFIGSYFYEPIDDELVYRFILDNGFGSKYYDQPVQSLGDAIKSQSYEYFNHSGRFLVHTITQMFAGVWGRTCFSICNSIIFLITLCALLRRCIGLSCWYQIIFSSIISFIFINIFPSTRIFPIAISLNYLWPLPLILIFIYELKKNYSTSNVTILKLFFLALLGFLSGATQEVYVLPLCVLTFFVIIKALCKKHRIGSSFLILCACFWIGSISVGLAPGTLNRASGVTHYSLLYFWEALKMLFSQPLFDLPLCILIYVCIFKIKIIRYLRFHILLIGVAVLFGLYAHTTNQSFSGVEFYSLLFIIECLVICFKKVRLSRKVTITIALIKTFPVYGTI